MKIKTKKQMNFPQLIEWAKKNDVRNRSYYGDRYEDRIFFTENQDVICDCVPINETFTVETETEITEDTKLNKIFLITEGCSSLEKYSNYSINDVLSDNEGYYQELAMLIMESEPTIIWTREKGLVE